MSQIQVDHVWKNYSAEPTLADVAFDIRAGDRIGLIGPNGCGKTTLLKIIAREIDPDRGTVQWQKGLRVGYLRQEYSGEVHQTMWDFARSAFREITQWAEEAERLAEAIAASADPDEHDALAKRFDLLQQRLHQADGFEFDHKIDRVLQGLGFFESQYGQTIDTLSGGQVNRLMLAQLLLSAPDVMLLDEPSNHLDMKATEWLEDFLRGTDSAFVIVSHDRYLLDRVIDQTLELIDAKTDLFPGNYSKYVRLKADRLDVQKRTYDKQRQEIEKLEEFVRRNHYGQKASQAEDRRKKLAQIELVEVPRQIEVPPMSFPPAARCGDIVIRASRLSKSYSRPLFSDLNFQIERGQRWGILGDNGTGKTTLLRCLLESDFAFEGNVTLGTGVRVAYFDQHLSCVDEDATPLDLVRPSHKDTTDQMRRDLLARFGIVGDAALQHISSLSGGQRNRVALARLAASDANLIVMDEPTNHLDLWSREALAKALSQFDGTVLIVSHDRYFINQLCDHLLLFEQDRVRVISGNYDTYRMLSQQAPQQPAIAAKPSKSQPATSNNEPPRRKRRFAYRKVEDIEAEITERENSIAKLHADLADPEVLRHRDRVLETKKQLDEATAYLSQLYDHWHEAIELN